MNLEKFKAALKEKIRQSDLDQVFEMLNLKVRHSSSIYDDIIQLNSMFEGLEKRESQGRIRPEESILQKNEIIFNLNSIINKLEPKDIQKEEIQANGEDQAVKQHTLLGWIIVGILATLSLLVIYYFSLPAKYISWDKNEGQLQNGVTITHIDTIKEKRGNEVVFL